MSDADEMPGETLLGAILVRTANVSLRSLQYALKRQSETGSVLGKTLFDMGLITEEQLGLALYRQREMRVENSPSPKKRPAGPAPVSNYSMLGAILTRISGMSHKTLKYALNRQRDTGGLVGELLVEMGVVTEEQLGLALAHQASMRTAALELETDRHGD